MALCDCVVVGGSLGGVAAALAIAKRGRTVCITEETDWLGGQATSQGVSALDEFWLVESFGATAAYSQFRQLIRQHYQEHTILSDKGKAMQKLNPGNAWVSKLCYEPRVGVAAIEAMLQPYVTSGQVRIFTGYRPLTAVTSQGRIEEVQVTRVTPLGDSDDTLTLRGPMVLDATELGDLLPLAGVDHVSGTQSVSDTGETHAYPGAAHPEWVQSFTYPFAVEFCPGENHTIPKPAGYEYFRDTQPYTFNLYYVHQGCKRFPVFPTGEVPKTFWNYRRLIDAELFADAAYPNDIAMINWPGNDYDRQNLIDKPWAEQLRIREEAKLLSLGLLYWLQTEAPRDDGGHGYPELKLRPDVMGTEDGLSKYPYIRESRRIRAEVTVKEEDLARFARPGQARARHFPDSVGLGAYFIDIHACSGGQRFNLDIKSAPHQVPLGALLAPGWSNFLPACKNIGVTHIANGTYRLHPGEWAVGEAAGSLAAFCLAHQISPHQVRADQALLRTFQLELVQAGVPLFWYSDVPDGHPAWEAVQYLSAIGVIDPDPARLEFYPEIPVGDLACTWGRNLKKETGLDPAFIEVDPTSCTRQAWALAAYENLQRTRA
jgi:hypothetical protein